MGIYIYLMCTFFANLYVLSTWDLLMVYMQVPIYILYLCDQMWLVGLLYRPTRHAMLLTGYVLC